MSYRQEMHHLSVSVRSLLAEGGQVQAADLPYALAGHLALVELLRTVERDLAIRQPETIELARRLSRRPNLVDVALSDLLPRTASTPTGELWRDLARQATLARHDWDQALLSTRPHRGARWSEITDIAYLAEATSILSGDIAASLKTAGRFHDATSFRIGNDTLAEAARNIRALTARRTLPVAGDLTTFRDHAVLIRLRPTALPEALYRLSCMLDSGQRLSPGSAALISRCLAETSLGAANSLQRTAPAVAAALRGHAERLTAATDHTRRTLALQTGDPKPVAQAQSIQRLVSDMRVQNIRLTPALAHAVSAQLPAVTRSLNDAAQREILDASWLVPDLSSERLPWRVADVEDLPPLAQDLRRAVAQANALEQRNTIGYHPGVTARPTPRQVLNPHLAPIPPAPTYATPTKPGRASPSR